MIMLRNKYTGAFKKKLVLDAYKSQIFRFILRILELISYLLYLALV